MRISISLILALGVTIGSIGSTDAETGLKIKVGLGYEYLSQEFFLDSVTSSILSDTLAGADSLEVSAALKTTYLDDFKGQLTLSYLPFDDYRLEVRSSLEQTPNQFRLRLATNYRPRIGSVSVDWSSEIERRYDNPDSSEVDDGYFSGYGRAKLAFPVSSVLSLWSVLRTDFVSFDSAGPGIFDYHRVGVQLGMSHTFRNFSLLSLDLFAMNREVPDSSAQDYLSYGLEGSFFGFYTRGQIDAVMRFETRDYERTKDLGDYRRGEIIVRNKHSLGGSFFAREELEIEALRYDSTDVLPQHYKRVELAILAGYSRDYWSIAAGPVFELLAEQATAEYTIGEDYVESGLKAQFDLVEPGLIFASLESVTGRRDLKDEGTGDDLHSDFTFERLNLLADCSIAGGLGLNLLFSADWEWHNNPEENSLLLLISTLLYYSF